MINRVKRVFVANRDVIGRRALILVGTGIGIAIAAVAYARTGQEPEVEVTETVEYDVTPDI